MGNPFILLDWRKPFFQEFLPYIFSVQNAASLSSEDVAIVFPHARAKKYYLHALENASVSFPYVSPALYTIQEYISKIAFSLIYNTMLPKTLAIHEEIYLIQSVLLSLDVSDSSLKDAFQKMSSKESFMWAASILPIIKALYTHCSFPKEYVFEVEDSLDPFAYKIVLFLKDIYLAYTSLLEKNGYTTDAYTLFKLAEYCKDNTISMGTIFSHQWTCLAGVAILNGSENSIIRNLWQNNAIDIILHTDPLINTHWESADKCTKLQKNWIQSWDAETYLYTSTQENVCTPKITLYESSTIQGELLEVASIVEKIGVNDTIIIPINSKLLLPLLHTLYLPESNISLGYPLDASSFISFLEYCMCAQENRNEQGYYWKNVLDMLRHFSYSILKNKEEYNTFFTIFTIFQEYIQKKKYCYVDLNSAYEKCFFQENIYAIDSLYQDSLRLLQDCFHILFLNWENKNTLGSLSLCMQDLLDFLHDLQKETLSVIDSEAYILLYKTIIPILSEGIMEDVLWEQANSFYIIREYITKEVLAFEENAQDTLQIVGLLEARLIPFKNIIIVDAVEGSLPTLTKENSLIPESIYNKLCSIPDSFQRDILTSYNFFRLLKSAETVHILYRKNIGKGIGETVTRSRFVEEIIWSWELEHGEILSVNTPNDLLHLVGYREESTRYIVENAIIKTDNMKEAIRNRLEQGISATMLSTYLSCPFKWAQRYIFSIRERNIENPDMEISPLLFGEAIHYALEQYFIPFIGKTLSKEDCLGKEEEIVAYVYHFFTQESLSLSVDTKIMLQNTLHRQMQLFLEQQAEFFTVMGLEKKYTAYIGKIPLFGRMDRIDMRGNTLHIMDYKTGKKIEQNPFSRGMRDIFIQLRTKEYSSTQDLIACLAKYATHSIQLYVYLYLMIKNEKNIDDINASFIFLGESPPVEMLLFTEKNREDDSEIIERIKTDVLEELFSLLINDMIDSQSIERRKEKRKCEHCPYASMCI
ncbi:MAG: PD-(D/E)XK nuclease family protein [Desulfovibrionaceae bacterium]